MRRFILPRGWTASEYETIAVLAHLRWRDTGNPADENWAWAEAQFRDFKHQDSQVRLLANTLWRRDGSVEGRSARYWSQAERAWRNYRHSLKQTAYGRWQQSHGTPLPADCFWRQAESEFEQALYGNEQVVQGRAYFFSRSGVRGNLSDADCWEEAKRLIFLKRFLDEWPGPVC